MTEDQIDDKVIKFVEYLDRLYKKKLINTKQYNTNIRDLYHWAEYQRHAAAQRAGKRG